MIFYFPDKFIELFTLNSTIICTIDNLNYDRYFNKISLIENVVFYENNIKKNLFLVIILFLLKNLLIIIY